MTSTTTTTTTVNVEILINQTALRLVSNHVKKEENKYTSVTTLVKELKKLDKSLKSSDIKSALNIFFEKIDKRVVTKDGGTIRKHNLMEVSINGNYEFFTRPTKSRIKKGTIYDFHLEDVSESKSFLIFDMFNENGEPFKATVFSSKFTIFNLLMEQRTALLGLELTFEGYLKKDSLTSLFSIEKLIEIKENEETQKVRDSFAEKFDWVETGAYTLDLKKQLFTKHSRRDSTGFKAVSDEKDRINSITSNSATITSQLTLIGDRASSKLPRTELSIVFGFLVDYLIRRSASLNSYYSVSSDKDYIATFGFEKDFTETLMEVEHVNYSEEQIEKNLETLKDLDIVNIINTEEMTNSAVLTLQKYQHNLNDVTAIEINKNSVNLLVEYYELKKDNQEDEVLIQLTEMLKEEGED